MMPSSGLIRLQGSFTFARHPAWEVRISALTANVSNSSGKNCKTLDRLRREILSVGGQAFSAIIGRYRSTRSFRLDFRLSVMTAVLCLISRLLLGSFILALLAAGSIWMLLHGSLPKYNGTVSVRSLANPVVIERDSLGSVTIRAQDRHEMIWALGYVHAQERFFEMDLMRRRAGGEL